MKPPAAHSDREWLLIGVAECCAAKGYEGTSIASICAAAGVSPDSFKPLFADRDECLAAAMEFMLAEARGRIEAVISPGKPWASALSDGATVLLELLAERPAFARTFLVEAPAVGDRPAALHAESRAAVLAFVERGASQELEEPGIPASAGRAALAGAETLIVGKILAGEGKRLGKLAPDVVYLLTVPYLGQREAWRLAAQPVARTHLRAVA